jgi:enterochelin esterase-like enzyme
MKLLCSSLLAASIALAQMPPRTSADAVKSPDVLPDHRVTFRLYAPNAKEVTASGDWRTVDTASTGKMEKDETGVWSLTTGPLRPDFYTYSFSVDGQRMPDPKNVNLKVGVASLESIVSVPGEEAEFETERRVPHGAVNMIWYLSSALDRQRRMHIYTPPGYETSREKYPVLYLIHGGGDNDSDWTSIGRANFILDNLLADKKIPPMIIVMPDGSTARAANAPIFRPGGRGGPEAGMTGDRFGEDLMGDIIPYVDGHYRTLATRDKRALAGLSMGGLQVLWFGLPNFEKFAWFGVFSSGQSPAGNAELERVAAPFFADPKKTNEMVRLLWISYGKTDIANANSKNLLELLSRHGIRNEAQETPGGHTWINWRAYLRQFAPLLFQTQGKAGSK